MLADDYTEVAAHIERCVRRNVNAVHRAWALRNDHKMARVVRAVLLTPTSVHTRFKSGRVYTYHLRRRLFAAAELTALARFLFGVFLVRFAHVFTHVSVLRVRKRPLVRLRGRPGIRRRDRFHFRLT